MRAEDENQKELLKRNFQSPNRSIELQYGGPFLAATTPYRLTVYQNTNTQQPLRQLINYVEIKDFG